MHIAINVRSLLIAMENPQSPEEFFRQLSVDTPIAAFGIRYGAFEAMPTFSLFVLPNWAAYL
jgi:hypothetical protein